MSERVASSTAVLLCQGRAPADGRYAVGRFSDPIARELLDPADRLIVDRVRADRTAVFEVDHLASQQDKLRRIGGLAPTAGRVVSVAIDLASERLGPTLQRAGFDRQAVTTCGPA